jgi:hypothetical protein
MEGTTQPIINSEPNSNFAGTSVASLLSQLKPFSAGPGVQNTPKVPPPPKTLFPGPHVSEPFVEDRRHYTFRESLPVLSELVENPSLVEAVKKVGIITPLLKFISGSNFEKLDEEGTGRS